MPGLECPTPTCNNGVDGARYITPEDGPLAARVELLKLHTSICAAFAAAQPTQCSVKAPSVKRPTVDAGISEEEWSVFLQKWRLFKVAARLDGTQIGPQLYDCCDPALQDNLLRENADFAGLTEAAGLQAVKNLAVIPVAICVRRAELLAMAQDTSETARAFFARVKGRADTCKYITKCSCNLDVNYTNSVVKDVF